MEDDNKKKYFNFPIVLLEGFLIDHKKCLNNILDYAMYAYCEKYDTDDVKRAARFLGVTLGNEFRTYHNGNELFDSIPEGLPKVCLLYTSPSPRDGLLSRMPSSA